ncbi:hypothetical protein Y1Q_0012489 [Alligator mississippiensis]|uniref:Uncharacterized protein n=1 Tax=Alligator mississippiensis TaxID=8496 RepID=A0A151M7T9_ALLMI|nr:hypothetical protein Y1Q_0012489 [Alligator mississippiensis]
MFAISKIHEAKLFSFCFVGKKKHFLLSSHGITSTITFILETNGIAQTLTKLQEKQTMVYLALLTGVALRFFQTRSQTQNTRASLNCKAVLEQEKQ